MEGIEFADLTENERTDFMGFNNSELLRVEAKDRDKFKGFYRRLCRSLIEFDDMWIGVSGLCMMNI